MYFQQLLSLLLQEISFSFFNEKNKTLNESRNISHFLCPNPSQ